MIKLFLGLKENPPSIEGISPNRYLISILDDFFNHQLRSKLAILGSWVFKLNLRKVDK
jgi:hypothetical protein